MSAADARAAAQPVVLVLEDGSEMPGLGFGARRPAAGEVVFNTAMSGYVETLTDPSYAGQILVLTYPLIGNYGAPAPRIDDDLHPGYESAAIQVEGLVVQEYVDTPSHFAAARTLGAWLEAEGVPAVTGIDTRGLTRRLREHGTMRGWMLPETDGERSSASQAVPVEMTREVFRRVAPREPRCYPGGEIRIMLVDVGAKDSIVRSLLARGATVDRVPWHADLATHARSADGIVIGNGPGDPKDLGALVEQVRGLLSDGRRPVFGICLGHQILARAAGADTFKLPYGHRGVNQPVQDVLTRRCYVTSQNHGYAVREDTLPSDWEPWFVNINDGTNEGVRSRLHPFSSIQFHPEAHPGPEDTAYLFDEYLRLVGAMRSGR